MLKRDDVIDLWRGQMKTFRTGRLRVGDRTVNVAFKRDGDDYVLHARLKNNHPIAFERFKAWSKAGEPMPAEEFRKSLSVRRLRIDSQHARVGWLKSAYLVAFAAFGYKWAWQTHLDIVREQIQQPSEVLIPRFDVDLHDDDPKRRLCLIVREPTELRGVAVFFRRQFVFLPFDEGSLYARLASHWTEQTHFNETLHGKEVPWPTQPIHKFDTKQVAA